MIIQLISARRAVFPVQYSNTPIERHEIERILEAANWAPTHRRTEPWRFKVFHSEDSRARLAGFLVDKYRKTAEKVSEIKAKKTAEKPLQSGCVIAICMQRDPLASVPEWEEIAAVAMAVQNMLLMATDMGIGAYWSTPSTIADFAELVPLNEGERCLGFFYMGKTDQELPEGVRKTGVSEKTTWF
jgi:nitroreductase